MKRNKVAICGTSGGYRKHYDLGEKPCEQCKQARSEARKKDYAENKEEHSKKAAEAYLHNAEKIKARVKTWKANNADKVKSHKNRRRAKAAEVHTEPYTWMMVIDTYGSNCHLCKEEIDLYAPRHAMLGDNWERGLHIDHLVSISKGGSDTLDNVRPAHAICNLRKGTK